MIDLIKKGLGYAIFFGISIPLYLLFSAPPIALSGIEKYSNTVPTKEAKELGMTLFKNKKYLEAKAFFEPSAYQGDVVSQLALATVYFYDLTTVNNYQQAYRWFNQNSDNAFAQYYLSLLYQFGHGVDQSSSLSLFWLLQSATQSFPPSQHNLATFHFNTGDYQEAYLWAMYARANGFSKSRSLVKQASALLSPAEKANADQNYKNTKVKHHWDDDQLSKPLEKVLK
ncbi:tetratricopeptide repeat protein [Shewanella sp. 10N.261.52.F9]|uniref:tetratricopeptide repeat protein n=1 Tax=Shewanella sp. 10N.261.52.F9 TaxID=3229684 RepID=UPI00354C0F2D